MLIMVTGGIGSGKSEFTLRYAAGLAREGIYIVTHDEINPAHSVSKFPCQTINTSDEQGLPSVIDLINRESNLFRADRRMVIIDSLTGWMHQQFLESRESDVGFLQEQFRKLSEMIFAYQGNLMVITNEMTGHPQMSERELLFMRKMGELNRALAQHCDQMFLMTSGIPIEMRSKRARL